MNRTDRIFTTGCITIIVTAFTVPALLTFRPDTPHTMSGLLAVLGFGSGFALMVRAYYLEGKAEDAARKEAIDARIARDRGPNWRQK